MRVCTSSTATPWFDYLFASLTELRDVLVDTPRLTRHVYEHEERYAVLLD